MATPDLPLPAGVVKVPPDTTSAQIAEIKRDSVRRIGRSVVVEADDGSWVTVNTWDHLLFGGDHGA